jgi:hypothetical protein
MIAGPPSISAVFGLQSLARGDAQNPTVAVIPGFKRCLVFGARRFKIPIRRLREREAAVPMLLESSS